MELSIRIKYKRPSTDVNWWKASKDYQDYMKKTYDDTGKRLSVAREGENTLERTVTTVWKDKDAFLEFKEDNTNQQGLDASYAYREANGIVRISVENKEGFFD